VSRSRLTLAVLAALLGATITLSGCGRRGGGPRGGVAASDSSFAILSYGRGRSPMELSLARGKVVYVRYCAICHGESGEGDGFNAYNIKAAYGVSPTAFADSAAFSSVHAEVVLAAIRNGGHAVGKSPAMPPWGHTLPVSDVTDVAEFVRSLSHSARQR
jgi:mono/diheme cytochrome c family protein